MASDEEIREILSYRTVAVVGCSPKEERASNRVAFYLRRVGYAIVPVNPGYPMILGERCYPNLLEIPGKIDIIVIFRRSEHVFPIVKDGIKIGAKAVWMQDGIAHLAAASLAIQSGLKVVMDDCIMRQHQQFGCPFHRTITSC
ncbi:MAG: CoA-binding protein [Elusimicrobia bacterium]|nr:CoA-binding protein [Elusimicrobiota bacterium]MBI4218291.1 CoA-binding protein [Elusimicrobiota bacterium]